MRRSVLALAICAVSLQSGCDLLNDFSGFPCWRIPNPCRYPDAAKPQAAKAPAESIAKTAFALVALAALVAIARNDGGSDPYTPPPP